MSGESAVSNNSTEEVEKEVKAEVKIMEAEKVCPPKVSGESPKSEESSCPAASSAESESKIDEEKKVEHPVKEEVKEIDGDEKLIAEDSAVVACPLAEKSEQKIEDKQVELPPSKEKKQIEDDSIVEAADKDIPEVEKLSVPEPDVGCASEPISEKIESKSEDKLDAKIDEKLEQSKVESAEEKQDEPAKGVALTEESSVKAVEEVVVKAEELPPKEVEAISEKEVTVSESACKQPGETGETKPDESVEGNPVEPAKIVDVAGQSSVEPFEGRVENVEEIPDKGVEIIEEKEVKVSEAEIKPEENSKTEPAEKLVGSKVEFIEEKQDEPEKIVELPEKTSVPAVEEKVGIVEELPTKNAETNEEKEANVSDTECKVDKNSETGTAAKQEESTAELVEEKLDEPTKIAHVPEQSSVEVVEKKVEELPAKNAEATTEKEVELSEAESKPEETKHVELLDKKPVEPRNIIEVPEQSLVKTDEEKLEKVDELPAKEVETIEEKAVKISEGECKPEEILETKPVELVEEKTVESAQKDDVLEKSSIEGVEEKLEKVEELPAQEVEAVKERAVKVSEAECEPEEIPETEPVEKQEKSEVELREVKPDKPTQIVDVLEQSSFDAEGKAGKGVELPVKEVEAISQKEMKVSDAEGKPEEVPDTEPVEKLKESSVDLDEEKTDKPTQIVDVPEQSSVEAVEDNTGKGVELPVKEVEAISEKEMKVSDAECKPEEIPETGPAEKLKQSNVELVEEKADQPTQIVDVPEQSLVEVVEDNKGKGVELPVKEVESILDKEMKVSDAECKPEEIPETEPVKKLKESKVELVEEKANKPTQIVDVPEHSSFETPEDNTGKGVELPVKEVEKEMKVSDAECKPEEIPDTEPAEKLKESNVDFVEEKAGNPTQIVDVPEQSPVEAVEDNKGKGVEFSDKEVEGISQEETKVSESECEPEEISETEHSTKVVNLPEKIPIKDVEDKVGKGVELLVKEVEATVEKEVKLPEAEYKAEEISDFKPAGSVEEKAVEPAKIVNVPEQSSVDVAEEKLEKVEELPAKVVEPSLDKEVKVLEEECTGEVISESVPLLEEEPVEQSKVTEPTKEETLAAEPVENLKVEDAKSLTKEEPIKAETQVEQTDVVCSTTDEVSEKTDATNEEKESVKKTVVIDALPGLVESGKIEVESKAPEEKTEGKSVKGEESPQCETKPIGDVEEPIKPETQVEQTDVVCSTTDEVSEKTDATNEEKESVKKTLVIDALPELVESGKIEVETKAPEEKTEDKSVKAEESPQCETKPTGDVEEPIKPETQVEQTDVVCSTTDEVSEKTDATNEEKESVKKTVVIDALPGLVESRKIKVETKAPKEKTEDKSVKAEESPQCETKPIEDAASSIHLPDFTEKPLEKDIASKDIDLVAENGNTKHETVASTTKEEEVEGNGDEEPTKEAEKTEPEKKIEDIAHSLKEKLEQEKHDDEASKINVQNTESTKECEDTKASEDSPKEDVAVKTTQKQSNNIIKMVKHSLVKAKKAIIGKSSNSKAPVSEIKGDDASK